MNIRQKKTKQLQIGDILIIDWLEIQKLDKNPIFQNKIYLQGYGDYKLYDKIEKKFEGESMIFLFEIDDIDKEFMNGKNYKKGMKYSFYHIDELFGNFPCIVVEGLGNLYWDVIDNPFHTLGHYKEVIKERNKEVIKERNKV